MVEFALVFPVILVLLMVAIDFGRVYLGWVNLQNMTRIAANFAANHADRLRDRRPRDDARSTGVRSATTPRPATASS